MTANSLVDSAISTATDKANDFVAIYDSDFTLIANMSSAPVSWI
jgi:hypothetical protein